MHSRISTAAICEPHYKLMEVLRSWDFNTKSHVRLAQCNHLHAFLINSSSQWAHVLIQVNRPCANTLN